MKPRLPKEETAVPKRGDGTGEAGDGAVEQASRILKNVAEAAVSAATLGLL